MANRLERETSPYLLQHKDNPVDWHPWGEEALARAREQDRPILVSIGYSACHWCHVMERESFEDAETAALMNDRFVCIKVDREERPDVDAIYMDAVQAMTGHGGWPLNAFLTPEGVPFYAGTYFPPEQRQGMPSWRMVLDGVARAWADQRDEIASTTDQVVARLRSSAELERARGGGRRVGARSGARAAAPGLRRRARRLGRRAEVPGRADDRVPAAARRAPDGAAHAAADGRRRHLRPDRRRLRALLGRRPLDRPALREDAVRQRAARPHLPARVPGLRRAVLRARLPRDAGLGAARPAPGRGRVRECARRRLRGRRGQVLRLDAGRGPRRPGRRRGSRARALRHHRRRQLRGREHPGAGHARPRRARGHEGAAARGPRAARLARARRQAPDGLERADDLGPGRRRRGPRRRPLPHGRGPVRGVRAARPARRRGPAAAQLQPRPRADRRLPRGSRLPARGAADALRGDVRPALVRRGTLARRRRSSSASPTRSAAASSRPPPITRR